MTSRARLRLPHTMYLPMNDDGTLTEPTELRITVQRLREHDGEPKPYRLLTVHPHMAKHHLVTLYSEFVPSRRIPADVQAMVDAFNSDIDRGWKALLVQHYSEITGRSMAQQAALGGTLNGSVSATVSASSGDTPGALLDYAKTFTITR